jgi:hypothetical protein
MFQQEGSMSKTRIVAAIFLLFLSSNPKLFGQAYRVGVDPRIELFSIVFRLAGNNEYTQGRVPSYLDAIDRYFAPYRDHPAVKLARELAETDDVGFNAPMDLAVHLDAVPSLAERVPFDSAGIGLDERWHGVKARRFVETLRSFVVDTKFVDFLKSQQPLYDVTNARLRDFVETNLDLAWYSRFSGVNPPVRLIVVPGLVNGGPSYGAGFTGTDGVIEMYAIPGVWQVDAQGLPQFSGTFLDVTVHEFAHSYFNSLIDKHYSEVAKAGDELYSRTASAMRRQAYGDGKTLLQESLVRAVTIRYLFDHQNPEAARRAIESERNNSFLWVPALSDLLTTYEKQRDTYPTLETFMPNVVRFFNDAAPRCAELKRQYIESRPKVVSISIANHSEDVDPSLTQIVIKFNRPMRTAPEQEQLSDPRSNRSWFDASGTVLTVGVSLSAGREYQFRLGWPGGGALVSAEGVPLDDYLIDFRTKSSNVAPVR